MAKTINTAGSQLFQQNLSNYNRERSRDELTQKVEANRLGNQLTALSLDPDINDPSLGQIGMAASVDPGGIIGTIAGAVGKVKQMDAMKLKAEANEGRTQQMADMIKSNFGEMTDADALMYARDPEKMKQFFNINNYSQGQKDRVRRQGIEDEEREYIRGRRKIDDTREDTAYSEEQDLKKNFRDLASSYEDIFVKSLGVEPEVAKMMASDPEIARGNMQMIWKEKMDDRGKQTLWDQYQAQIVESTGIKTFDQFKVMDEMPVPLMNDIVRRGAAKKMIGYNDDLLDQRTSLENQYTTQSLIAGQIAIDEMYTDGQAEQFALSRDPRAVVSPQDYPELKKELYNLQSVGENGADVIARRDSIVNGRLGGLKNRIDRNNQEILKLHTRYPSLATGPLSIGSASYLAETLPEYRPGTFYTANNAKFRVVSDGQGNNISKPELEWNDEDKTSYVNRYGTGGGITGPGASLVINERGDELDDMPSSDNIKQEANSITASINEENEVQSRVRNFGTTASRKMEKEQKERKELKNNFQKGVQDMVKLSSKEVGVDADVFNFDTKTIGDSNQLGTLISNEGKQVNIGGMFKSPEDGYTGYMNYKQARGGKNKKLLYSKPILISEFIQKINGPDAESELGLTSKQVKDYKKLINSANAKSEKLNSLGFEDGKYPDLKNMENMLKPDSAVIDVNPSVTEEVSEPQIKGDGLKSIDEVINGIDDILREIKEG